jgi:hypothetical protein
VNLESMKDPLIFQEERKESVQRLAVDLNALSHFVRVDALNPSSNLPYHNNQHAFTVALNVVEGAEQHGLSVDEKRLLFIAALYHDWDHTGTADEKENIRRAVEGCLDGMREDDESEADRWTVMLLIYATAQYFYNPPSLSLMKRLLRDADLMQNVEPDREIFFRGLSKELGMAVDADTTQEFLRKHVFLTSWGKQKVSKLVVL